MIDKEHVLLIGRNLTTFLSLHIDPDVKSINVHCNDIKKIEGLENLRQLQNLDVSSNKISDISGLRTLTSLTHLNLASNFITTVSGIGTLKQLVYLNLSYNGINSIAGLLELHGYDSRLEIIELHGNNLKDLNHIVSCLRGIISLKHLVLKFEASTDSIAKYQQNLFDCLPQLVSLDHLDRQDNDVEFSESDELSGFESLNFENDGIIEFSNRNLTNIDSSGVVDTPHIDAVLAVRKSIASNKSTPIDSNPMSQSIASKQPSQSSTTNSLKSDSIELTNDENEKPTSDKVILPEVNSKISAFKSVTSTSSASTPLPAKRSVALKPSKIVKPKVKPCTKRKSLAPKNAIVCSSSKCEDVIEKETYLNLLKELESERERRWKAEQASRKLVGVLREIQTENCEGKSLQQVAANTAERLKQTLLSERNVNDLLRQQNNSQSAEIEKLTERLSSVEKENEVAVHDLHASLSKANVQLNKLKCIHAKHKQDNESKVSALAEKCESAQIKIKDLQSKLDGFQNMMMAREEEYRKSVAGMYSMANEDFRNAIGQELSREAKRHQQELLSMEQQIHLSQVNYSKLENEFREALYIESERYKNVVEKYNESNSKLLKSEAMITNLAEKEDKCRSMMQEMTSIIKEQKVKVAELSKCKEEMAAQYQHRIQSLEQENQANRKKDMQLQTIKQENARLIAEMTALQSVVDGLKEQRKVWGRELAQQGSSLAQDRGRLEMKIESLKAEVSNLSKNNERDLDALRIKTKVVEDQTETICKMKEALASKDKEVRQKLEEQLLEHRKMQEAIEDLTKDNALLQEENMGLVSRKQELKKELVILGKDKDSLQIEFEKQKKKWLEKGSLLSKLELQVKRISENSKQKELKLIEEKNDALRSLQLAKSKSDQLVGAYQEQLNSANAAHEQEIECLQRDKREEVKRMQDKVVSVEQEMVDLLKESEEKKKEMEVKVDKLKSMLQQLT